MSTKTTQTGQSAYTFDPTSMAAFQSFLGGGQNVLLDTLQDPLKQSGFAQRTQMANQNAFNLFSRNNANISNRASWFGGANMPGFLQNQLLQSGNQLSANQANIFNENLLFAEQLRQQAAGSALGYRPLTTGGTSTQTQEQSGLGTWLPQVAGMGLSAATMGMGGGAGLGAGFFKGATSGNLGFGPGFGKPGFTDPGAPDFGSGVPGMGSQPWGAPSSPGVPASPWGF